MADGRKLKINFLNPSNNSSSLTVSNVNTDGVSNESLKSFATGLINLTDNTYTSATKIDEQNID